MQTLVVQFMHAQIEVATSFNAKALSMMTKSDDVQDVRHSLDDKYDARLLPQR